MKQSIKCKVCGARVEGIHSSQRYCSPECARERRREQARHRYAANYELMREQTRRWKAANPEKVRETRRQRNYIISRLVQMARDDGTWELLAREYDNGRRSVASAQPLRAVANR